MLQAAEAPRCRTSRAHAAPSPGLKRILPSCVPASRWSSTARAAAPRGRPALRLPVRIAARNNEHRPQTGHRHRRSRRLGQEHHRRPPGEESWATSTSKAEPCTAPSPSRRWSSKFHLTTPRRFAPWPLPPIIQLEPQPDGNRVLLDGRDVSQRIRESDVTLAASRVSIHPPVRQIMVSRQRAHGRQRWSRHGRPRHRHCRFSQRRRESISRCRRRAFVPSAAWLRTGRSLQKKPSAPSKISSPAISATAPAPSRRSSPLLTP